MIIGIITQAVYAPNAIADDDAYTSPTVMQVITCPTYRTAWTRTISGEHPRRTWRTNIYDLDRIFGYAAAHTSFSTPYEKRSQQNWHLFGEPLLFQMSDDEARELSRGTMPRNAALRASRALEARRLTLVGGSARSITYGDARSSTPKSLEAPTSPRASMATLNERLSHYFREIDHEIEKRNLSYLSLRTPREARGRGLGHLLNRSDLFPDTAPAEPSPIIVTAPATPTPPPAPAKPTRDPSKVYPGDTITASDGQPYVARKIDAGVADLSDVQLYRDLGAKRKNVLLSGWPGTGKTRGLQAAFPDAIIIQCTGDTTVEDLVGGYVPVGASDYRWVDGPLTIGAEEGRHVVLDEIAQLDPRVASVSYSLLDGRDEMLVTSNPARGIIKAKPGFSLSGTHNPASNRPLAEPLSSRFTVQLEVGTDWEVMRSLGVAERFCQFGAHLNAMLDKGEIAWAPQAREALAFKDNEEMVSTLFALRALIASAPEIERDVVATLLKERYGDRTYATKIAALKVD